MSSDMLDSASRNLYIWSATHLSYSLDPRAGNCSSRKSNLALKTADHLTWCSGAGVPLMAAGGGAGVITIWNLEVRRLHTVIKDAHDGPLMTLHFFPGEPLLMSSAADNSVKQWVFDSADNTARLLKFRSGHSAPPTCIKHYGEGLRCGRLPLTCCAAAQAVGCPQQCMPAAIVYLTYCFLIYHCIAQPVIESRVD